MSTISHKPRVKLAQSERSAVVASRVGRAIKSSPYPETVAMRILAERILSARDDLVERTNGKVRTWAKTRRKKDTHGRVYLEEEMPRESRLKSVGATLGSMLTAEHRNTPTWVLDAIEDGLGLVPWPQP